MQRTGRCELALAKGDATANVAPFVKTALQSIACYRVYVSLAASCRWAGQAQQRGACCASSFRCHRPLRLPHALLVSCFTVSGRLCSASLTASVTTETEGTSRGVFAAYVSQEPP